MVNFAETAFADSAEELISLLVDIDQVHRLDQFLILGQSLNLEAVNSQKSPTLDESIGQTGQLNSPGWSVERSLLEQR